MNLNRIFVVPRTGVAETFTAYVCEKCGQVFEIPMAVERKCPTCHSEFVRKFREEDECDRPLILKDDEGGS